MEFSESDIANQFAANLLKNGLIAKPTQRNIIRFSPPLIINQNEMDQAIQIIESSWKELNATIWFHDELKSFSFYSPEIYQYLIFNN